MGNRNQREGDLLCRLMLLLGEDDIFLILRHTYTQRLHTQTHTHTRVCLNLKTSASLLITSAFIDINNINSGAGLNK